MFPPDGFQHAGDRFADGGDVSSLLMHCCILIFVVGDIGVEIAVIDFEIAIEVVVVGMCVCVIFWCYFKIPDDVVMYPVDGTDILVDDVILILYLGCDIFLLCGQLLDG